MKPIRISAIFSIAMLAILLSACSGASSTTSWPGVSAPDGRVYVAYNNRVHALDADNGTLVWQYPAEAERRTFYAAPIEHDGQVIIGDYTNLLVGLDANTGQELWRFTQAKDRWIASPLVTDSLILAPSADHNLYALNRQGALQWKFTSSRALWSNPVADGERVYQASMDHYIYALDQSSGNVIWSTDLGGAMIYSPSLGEGTIYAATLANEVLALEAESGSILWRTKLGNILWAQPVLHEGQVYLGDIAGNVYSLDEATGAQTATLNLGEGIAVIGRPTIISDGVVFATEKNGLMAVSFDLQRRLWTKDVHGTLYTGPVTAEDRLVVGVVQGDNLLVAMNEDGSDAWTFLPEE